jgi:diketogulonate reductase-like aldo/keto reductase
MKIVNQHYTLHNGIQMPKLGLGTYKLSSGQETYDIVLNALAAGIRHIDSAIVYQNETSVGKAILDSGINRENIFITSKLPPHVKNFDGAIRMFERTLKNLGTDYLDLYIINAPRPFNSEGGDYDAGNIEAYKALEHLYKEERVSAIGVSQFEISDLENIINHCEIIPHVNQISFFIGHTQDALVKFCQKHQIFIQAFSPLGKGYIFNNPIILDMAKKYHVEPAQIALRYNIQKQTAPIPKTSKVERLKINTMLDFEISTSDIDILDAIKDDPRQYND